MAVGAGWLAGLMRLLPEVEERDVKWGRTTNRQRVVAGLAHFSALADGVGRFPSTGEACRRMEARLRERWPPTDCELRPYPFEAGAGSSA